MDKHDSTEPPRADISRLYCEACDAFRPVQFDAPDIVCKHCHFIIATAEMA